MRATHLSLANYNTTLSSDSLESGTGSSNSLRSANQSPHFAYILERAENSARNAAFFPPETHRREPAHAGFARLNPTKVLSDLWRRPQRREATASSNRARLGKAGLKRGGMVMKLYDDRRGLLPDESRAELAKDPG